MSGGWEQHIICDNQNITYKWDRPWPACCQGNSCIMCTVVVCSFCWEFWEGGGLGVLIHIVSCRVWWCFAAVSVGDESQVSPSSTKDPGRTPPPKWHVPIYSWLRPDPAQPLLQEESQSWSAASLERGHTHTYLKVLLLALYSCLFLHQKLPRKHITELQLNYQRLPLFYNTQGFLKWCSLTGLS